MIRFLFTLFTYWGRGWLFGKEPEPSAPLCLGSGRLTRTRPGHTVGYCAQCRRIIRVNPFTGKAMTHEVMAKRSSSALRV